MERLAIAVGVAAGLVGVTVTARLVHAEGAPPGMGAHPQRTRRTRAEATTVGASPDSSTPTAKASSP